MSDIARRVSRASIPHVYRHLVEQVEAQGGQVELLRKHLRITHPESGTKVIFPSTPGDQRGQRNLVADLRRSGFVINGRGQHGPVTAVVPKTPVVAPLPDATRAETPVQAAIPAPARTRHARARGSVQAAVLAFVAAHPDASTHSVALGVGLPGNNTSATLGYLRTRGLVVSHTESPRHVTWSLRSPDSGEPVPASTPSSPTAASALPGSTLRIPDLGTKDGASLPPAFWKHVSDALMSLAAAAEELAR